MRGNVKKSDREGGVTISRKPRKEGEKKGSKEKEKKKNRKKKGHDSLFVCTGGRGRACQRSSPERGGKTMEKCIWEPDDLPCAHRREKSSKKSAAACLWREPLKKKKSETGGP